MKWVLFGLTTLAVVPALFAFIGSRLAPSHRASVARTFPVAAEVIWAAITDVDAFPSWREGVKRVERLPDRNGLPVWIEERRSGKMTLAIERMERPRIVVGRIADPNLPFGGTWTYEIVPDGLGSCLTITENGEIYNPMFRFMARFILGYEGTIRSYMSSLEKRLAGSPARS
jgi:polyketide cyclase/dehydrase/lipid transport protein